MKQIVSPPPTLIIAPGGVLQRTTGWHQIPMTTWTQKQLRYKFSNFSFFIETSDYAFLGGGGKSTLYFLF